MKNTIKKLLSMVIIATMCMTSLFCITTYAVEEKIPDDAVEFNGHYYKAFNTSKSWKEAKTYCESLGGYLATITTAEEQNFIVDTFLKGSPAKKCYFLGGYRESISSSVWYWVTEEPFSYNNWGGGENTQSDEYGQIYTIIASGNSTWMQPYKWYSHMNYDTGTSIADWAGKYTGFICEWDNIYNLGEETYGFKNYNDSDSRGHCFGMSVTSSGYYLKKLPLPYGIKSAKELNKYAKTGALKTPICYYQQIQGSIRDQAMVAGGTNYANEAVFNIEADWNEVVSFVSSHEYDGKGLLQIGYRKMGEGGHSINFLRYDVVNGQERIYAYDNNCPTQETYFYQDENGDIRQAVYSSFSGSIDCITLRSVPTYLVFASVKENAEKYRRLAIYADDSIKIEGAKRFLMDGEDVSGACYVYEIPEDITKVKIIPLVDNAEFTYMDKQYSFGKVDNDTFGMLNLANSDLDSSELTIHNAPGEVRSVSVDDISLDYKSNKTINTKIITSGEPEYIVEYASSNSDIVSVDENGNVTAKGTGSAEITVTVTDENGNVAEDTCTVTVSYAWWQWIIIIILFGWIWY